MGGDWKGATDADAIDALHRAVELGCNFFDTAWAYGRGHAERLLGQVVGGDHTQGRLRIATKIPPKNFEWPSRRGMTLDECFPRDHIRQYTERSLENLGLSTIDLIQFHVWEDDWADDERWPRAIDDLKRQGMVRAVGISVNRWEPNSVLNALRTDLVDAVQVVYNIFDQAPQDHLFPLCREKNVAVIARVPFDEGTLTGTLTQNTTWAVDDWRAKYFTAANLAESLRRAEALAPLLPDHLTLPELALRFVLADATVSTVIPGMRRRAHVEENMAASDGRQLPDALLSRLREHRWDRGLDYLGYAARRAGFVSRALERLGRLRHSG